MKKNSSSSIMDDDDKIKSPKKKISDTQRLVQVEKNLEQAIDKMNGIDDSLLALTSKLDAVFGKVMGFPAPLNQRITTHNSENDEVPEEVAAEMMEEEVEEHQRMLLSSAQEAYDEIEVMSDIFPTVEKDEAPVVINDSDAWRINPKNRCQL